MSHGHWLRGFCFVPCPKIFLGFFATEDEITVARRDFLSFDEVKGFVFAVDVVGFYRALPDYEDGEYDYRDQEGAVETFEEVFRGEDVVAERG